MNTKLIPQVAPQYQYIIDESLEAPDSGDGDYPYPEFEDEYDDGGPAIDWDDREPQSTVYCDVCGYHYDAEDPCKQH